MRIKRLACALVFVCACDALARPEQTVGLHPDVDLIGDPYTAIMRSAHMVEQGLHPWHALSLMDQLSTAYSAEEILDTLLSYPELLERSLQGDLCLLHLMLRHKPLEAVFLEYTNEIAVVASTLLDLGIKQKALRILLGRLPLFNAVAYFFLPSLDEAGIVMYEHELLHEYLVMEKSLTQEDKEALHALLVSVDIEHSQKPRHSLAPQDLYWSSYAAKHLLTTHRSPSVAFMVLGVLEEAPTLSQNKFTAEILLKILHNLFLYSTPQDAPQFINKALQQIAAHENLRNFLMPAARQGLVYIAQSSLALNDNTMQTLRAYAAGEAPGAQPCVGLLQKI